MEKELAISVIVVVVILGLGIFLTQNTSWFKSSDNYTSSADFNDGSGMNLPDVNAVECSSDSDCSVVQSQCCPCSSGGEELCVAKSSEKGYLDRLAGCDKNLICAQVFNCKINSCSCVNGRCEGN